VGIEPKRAVAQHPELAGTYSELHAARLVALQQNYRHPADLERFVNRTREAIAQEIERGEPLSAPLVKARYRGTPSPRAYEQVQERTLWAMDEPPKESSSVPRIADDGWLVGKLVAHGKAPYPKDPEGKMSYFIQVRMLETEQGAASRRRHEEQAARPIDGRTSHRALSIHDGGLVERWGADLERAVRQSRSHVQIGQVIAAKIVDRRRIAPDPVTNEARYKNTWQVETVQFVARQHRFARAINESRRNARQDGVEGPEALALYLIHEGAERLAAVRYVDAADREAFVTRVREFFAASPGRERLIAKTVERLKASKAIPSDKRDFSHEPPTRE
jgi:hypothetical protein